MRSCGDSKPWRQGSRNESQTESVSSGGDVVGIGGDLEPETLLAAYQAGVFPMPVERDTLAWWCPEQRGIIPLDGLKVSRSLAKACTRYDVTINTAFDDVIAACADPSRTGGWITAEIINSYTRLHHMGWAHSVETRTPDGELVGGLYGIAIGRLFAGESMFHRATDASKVALVRLVEMLRRDGFELLDVQWLTPHLASLGAIEVPRQRYLELLANALARSAKRGASRRWDTSSNASVGPVQRN
jgi:leucyl/phenylalanyl-tRNA---protein transferase